MLSATCLDELKTQWLPQLTNSGLDRLIELLEKSSPLLIHGSFVSTMPMGCLASHAGWHHPKTAHLNDEAGVIWLEYVVGLRAGSSAVVREWDAGRGFDWPVRCELLENLKQERLLRGRPTAKNKGHNLTPAVLPPYCFLSTEVF